MPCARRLDGIPHTLELAAACLAGLTMEQSALIPLAIYSSRAVRARWLSPGT